MNRDEMVEMLTKSIKPRLGKELDWTIENLIEEYDDEHGEDATDSPEVWNRLVAEAKELVLKAANQALER